MLIIHKELLWHIRAFIMLKSLFDYIFNIPYKYIPWSLDLVAHVNKYLMNFGNISELLGRSPSFFWLKKIGKGETQWFPNKLNIVFLAVGAVELNKSQYLFSRNTQSTSFNLEISNVEFSIYRIQISYTELNIQECCMKRRKAASFVKKTRTTFTDYWASSYKWHNSVWSSHPCTGTLSSFCRGSTCKLETRWALRCRLAFGGAQ